MQISSLFDFSNAFLNLRSQGRGSSLTRRVSPQADQRQQILFARDKVSDLQKALQKITKNWRNSGGSSRIDAARTQSADLGLGAATAAYLESTEEVNAEPTSIETHGPEWTGPSTALATIDGEYDGSQGTGTLTFEVTRGGTIGQDGIRVEVFRPDGSRLRRINIRDDHDPGRLYNVGNGLRVSFDAGDLDRNDTFTLDVFDDVGGVANADMAFNGTRNLDANLEYRSDVTAGSFEVNGVTIDVAADDSINSVLAKINASIAGVTANYSAVTELITISHDTPGAAGNITLENDTSGFLDATKLRTANLVEGNDPDLDRVLSEVDRFSGITAGDILINGVAIGLDPDQDSLQDVLDRINASAAGATASIDATGRFVTFAATDPQNQLILDDNGRGFFPALEVTAGTFDPVESITGASGMTGHRAKQVAKAMREASEAINALYGIAVPGQEPGTWLKKVRGDLQTSITDLLEDRGKSKMARIGIKVDWGSPTGQVFSFNGNERSRLTSAIAAGSRSVEGLLFAGNSEKDLGFVDGLLATTAAAGTALEAALGDKGRYVDFYA